MLTCNVCVPYIVISVGAVHPYYESRKRLLNDSRPGRGECAKKARYNARKELRKRVSVVSNDLIPRPLSQHLLIEVLMQEKA